MVPAGEGEGRPSVFSESAGKKDYARGGVRGCQLGLQEQLR